MAGALLGCGAGDTASGPTAGTDEEDMPMPGTSLTVTVRPAGPASTPTVYTLTCDPPGGDHPDPQAACAALEEAMAAPVNPLDPVPATQACTEIYGGDQTALVEGTIDGQAVRAEMSRVNGCEIARWDALVDVLVEPGGVTPSA